MNCPADNASCSHPACEVMEDFCMERMIQAELEDEREACAKLVEWMYSHDNYAHTGEFCGRVVTAIRARGKP